MYKECFAEMRRCAGLIFLLRTSYKKMGDPAREIVQLHTAVSAFLVPVSLSLSSLSLRPPPWLTGLCADVLL